MYKFYIQFFSQILWRPSYKNNWMHFIVIVLELAHRLEAEANFADDVLVVSSLKFYSLFNLSV